MTEYAYKCSECGCEQDFKHSMKIGPPKVHECIECSGVMKRNFNISIIIPHHFNESGNKIKYDKSPSGRKHFWPASK